MKLGSVHLWGGSLDGFRSELRLSRELGYDIIGIGDSPAGWRDLYVTMTVAAMETDSAIITPMVTSPFLRHPLVVANAFSSLQALSGGRMALGLAVGGSNVFSVGRKQATQREIREYWDAIDNILDGKSISWEGRSVSPLQNPCKTPVFYSAFGPKSLKLAGEKAAGVIMFTDGDLTKTAKKIQLVRDGARDAGRNPADVEIWVIAYCSIRDKREQAIEDLHAFLMPNALTFVHTPELFAQVPDAIKPELLELSQRYDMSDHVMVNGKNVQTLREYGPELSEFLASIHTVAGTPDYVKSVIDGLKDLEVSAFLSTICGHANGEGQMRALAKLVKG